MRNLVAETPCGQVVFSYEGWSSKPVAVMFHGYLRPVDSLFAWAARLPDFNVVFARLPSHQTPAVPGGLWTWIDAFRSAIGGFPAPPELVIGESLGALVALGLPFGRVVAIEPFLRTGKLWPVHTSISAARSRGAEIGPDFETLFEGRDYTDLLRRISRPTLVIAGDQPLDPPRQVDAAPSLLDAEDFAALSANSLVSACRIPGGHDILSTRPDDCLRLIETHLAAAVR